MAGAFCLVIIFAFDVVGRRADLRPAAYVVVEHTHVAAYEAVDIAYVVVEHKHVAAYEAVDIAY
ncbi:MAG TPA: hypothetical protein VK671_09195, partial [Mucilaginibacter sp.]|nr:hypothetical protein [Mucilaginibacter sp.]